MFEISTNWGASASVHLLLAITKDSIYIQSYSLFQCNSNDFIVVVFFRDKLNGNKVFVARQSVLT